MNNKNYIYIFVHIPKTAGLTFRYHITKNMAKDEHLLLNVDRLGLKGTGVPVDSEVYIKKAHQYLKNLTGEQKSKLKIIYGHRIPHGIHKYFKREARYFTFVRNPVKRTVSMFNHKMDVYLRTIAKGIERKIIRKTFLINGKVPEFSEWLDRIYNVESKHLTTMYDLLTAMKYIKDDKNIIDLMTEAMNQFYFVGLVDNYRKDSLFVYHLLGFNKFFSNKNVSKKHFVLSSEGGIADKIVKKNRKDFMIYNKAIELNREFKRRNKGFDEIVKSMERKRKLILPLTQSVYSIGDRVKITAKTILANT